MERKILMDLLVKNMCNRDNKELDATLYQVKTDIIEAIRDDNIEGSRRMISDAKSILPILLNNVDKNKLEYLVGKYAGWIEVLDELVNVEYVERERYQKAIDKIQPKDKNYVKFILSNLESNISVRFDQLLDTLKTDKERLANIICILEEGGLIDSFTPGKDAYYTLTARGAKYLRDIQSAKTNERK